MVKINSNFWKNKKVFITGHTGFKGSWASIILNYIGAKTYGFSDSDDYEFFKKLKLKNKFNQSYLGDMLNKKKLEKAIKESKPNIIFHFASQPIVKNSLSNSYDTIYNNFIGCLNLLEILKKINSKIFVVIVTTDKVYENINKLKKSYSEADKLGGKDPYSASKSCKEIITKSYNDTFFINKKIKIVTVRCGNVLGGGDFSQFRILPDFFRSLKKNKSLIIRSPLSTRPWLYVLDAINGYFSIVEKYYNKKLDIISWNFGPQKDSIINVKTLTQKLSKYNNFKKVKYNKSNNNFEAKYLQLNSELSKKKLVWSPLKKIDEILLISSNWYKIFFSKKINEINSFNLKLIKEYLD